MRTNHTVSQDKISAEIIAELSNAPTNTDWIRRWIEVSRHGVMSPSWLQRVLDERLLPLFDDAPYACVRRFDHGKLQIVRVVFTVHDLYRGLSDLRRLRRHMRAASWELDAMSPEERTYYEAELDAVESAVADLKQIQRYVASIDLTKRSSCIALGGDPDAQVYGQEFVLYLLQSLDGHYFFSDLQTQAWMQDFYSLACEPENKAVVNRNIAWLHHNIADMITYFMG